MDLIWNKCVGDVWCRLDTLNLGHEHFNNMVGVYVIWHGGTEAATVKVGRGNIRNELLREKTDPQIRAFANLGLFVTWASAPEPQAGAVQAFLGQALRPRIPVAAGLPPPDPSTLPW